MSGARDAAPVVVLSSRAGFERLVGPTPRSWRPRLRFAKPGRSRGLDAELRRARLVVSKSTLRPEIVEAVLAARRAGTPTLLLVDGPLEWSNLYAHPRLANHEALGLYDPVVHDAVAAIGEPQRRFLEARNAGRGVAFATYANRRIRSEPPRWRRPAAPSFDFLLTTARTPAREAPHRRELERALETAGAALARTGWRVLVRVPDPRLRARLRDVLPGARFSTRGSFVRALLRARAVIGTPSSVVLEAMHHDRPTALLAFGDRPLFYGAGWRLDEHADWPARFDAMLRREPTRMAAQRSAVRAQLSSDDFFDVLATLLTGDRLAAPRPIDALDRAFALALGVAR